MSRRSHSILDVELSTGVWRRLCDEDKAKSCDDRDRSLVVTETMAERVQVGRCDGLDVLQCDAPSSAVLKCDCGKVIVVNRVYVQLRTPFSKRVLKSDTKKAIHMRFHTFGSGSQTFLNPTYVW